MHKSIAMVSLLAVVALAGCFGAEETGSASIYVKDAPTDEFDEIHVVFTKVQIHAAGGGNNTTAGWITLFENETGQDIDLLSASGDAAAFLGEANLTAGKYTQIRIDVLRAYGVVDGNETDFTVSSGTVKVVGSFDVKGGEETKITVDFDLDQSIKQQGQGGWRMTPKVGKTIVEHVDDATSGDDVAEEGEIA